MMRVTRLSGLFVCVGLLLAACNSPLNPTVEPHTATATDTPMDTVPEVALLEDDSGADTSMADPFTTAEQLEIAPNANSSLMEGTLAPGESASYELEATSGQSLYTHLLGEAAEQPNVILAIEGQDGTPLLSTDAQAVVWEGIIPATQSYIITVSAIAQTDVAYVLDIIFSPVPAGEDLPSLTITSLKNAEYHVCDALDCSCQMSDGFCQLPLPEAGLLAQQEMRLSVWGPTIAFGDMNGDNVEDALVILDVHTPDTTGHFKYAALVLNQAGEPHNVVSWILGDRVMVESVAILSGLIDLQITDPFGAGTPQTVTYNYRWDGESLDWMPCSPLSSDSFLDTSDRCSIVRAVDNFLVDGDTSVFEALLSGSEGINYVNNIEGAQPVSVSEFLSDLSQRLASNPTCDRVRMDEAGETLQIWTSGWNPPWEIHYFLYDAKVTVEPPWTSQIAAFMITKRDDAYELTHVWLNEDDVELWEDIYGLETFSCTELGNPAP